MTDCDRSQKLGIKGNAVNPDVGKGELTTEHSCTSHLEQVTAKCDYSYGHKKGRSILFFKRSSYLFKLVDTQV